MNAKLDLVLEHVAAAGVDLRATGEDRWRGDCVACGGHDRMTVGLDLNEDVFLKCWSATCRSQDILDALGLSWDDLKARSDLEVGGADPAAALRAARVNLIERIREGIPELEYVAGMAGAFVRGKRHHVAGELKSGKSLSIGIVASVDIVAAGGIVVVLDRENGAEEYARRLARVLDARKAGDRLRDRLAENFRYYAWPAVRLEWGQDPGYPEAIAGADLVVFDSARRFLTVTDMTEDSSDDFARFSESLVDPLMRAGIATCILDNVGHSAKDRARGSSSKGDLADLVFVLKTTEPFNLDTRSRLELRCTASRFGEIHGTWELELGGGGYGHWCELEHPQRREEFLKACLTVLQERSPLGRDSLIKAAREHGAWGRNEVLRNWLAEFVGEELLAHNQGGFCPLAPRRGHSGATPRPGPAPLAPAPLRGRR